MNTETIHSLQCVRSAVALRSKRIGFDCQHCGYTEAIPQSQAEVIERDFDSYRPEPGDWEMETRQWHCEQCGADTTTERSITSFNCPFCASNLVSASDELLMRHKPESLLPFRITSGSRSDFVPDTFLWFRPNRQTQARAGRIRGTYMPYWTFDTLTRSFWTAQSGTYYYVKNSKGERERKIRWQRVSGNHTEFFDDELVVGSNVVDHGLLGRIEPFPTSELTAFQEQYLAGHMALGHEVDMLECWPTAKARIDNHIRAECRRAIPGDTHRGLSVTTSYMNRTYKLCLLPIWIAAYRYRDTSYSYVVNGVTGNIAGKAPWSAVKLMSALAVLVAALYAGYRYFG